MPNAHFNGQVTEGKPTVQEPKAPAPETSSKMPGELLDLSVEDRRHLKKLCKEAIEHWDESTSEHMEDLRRWNDLSEGVVEATDWPWPGASSAHIPLIETHMKSVHSVVCRSMLTVSPLWFGRTFESDMREVIPDVEDMLDYKAKSDLNTVDAVRGVVWNTTRDAIGWTKTYYAKEYEKVYGVVVAESPEDFTRQFPDADSAGMEIEEYNSIIERIRAEGSPGNPVEIPIEYEKVVYEGPKTDVIEEAEFIQAPATAVELRDCWAYGHWYYAARMPLQRKVRDGEMWDKAVEKLLASGAPGSAAAWKAAKDRNEGVSDKSTKKSGQYRLAELVIVTDMDGDGEDERYICQYSKEKDILLGAVKYYFECEIYQDWRILKKSGRRLGMSIPGELENVNTEVDDSVRQDINSSKIDSVPVFIGKKAVKKDLDDAGFFDQFFKPGGFLGTENGKADVASMDVKGTDKRFSQSMRQEFVRYSEMLVGPTQMLSGRESPIDPEAPGNKTIALIQQSNMRIEDYINELRKSFDKLGEIILSLYHQFGPNSMQFRSRRGESTLNRVFLGRDIRLSTHGVTAMENPDVEFNKAKQWLEILLPYPGINKDPVRLRELYNRVMIAGRLQGRDDLLPSKEEVTGEQQKAMEAEMRDKIMQDLVAKGIIPPPPPPGMPGNIPPPGIPGGPPPASAPGLPPAMPMPGAPAGAPGLPPINNLPPVGV